MVVDFHSSLDLGILYMIHPLLVAGELSMKTVAAKQLSIHTHTHTHTHTHIRTKHANTGIIHIFDGSYMVMCILLGCRNVIYLIVKTRTVVSADADSCRV